MNRLAPRERAVALLREGWALALVMVGFLAAVAEGLRVRAPLGHDEAVYMVRGRELLDAGWSTTFGDYWHDYRAPGLPLLIALGGRVVGVHVTSSRVIVAVLGAVSIGLTWWIVRHMAGRLAGDISALLLAVTGGFVLTSSTLLADVPGAAFSLAAVASYWHDVRRGRLRWSLVLVPALTFAATTARFGSPFMVAAGLLGVSVVALPQAIRERNAILGGQAVLLAAATGLSCALVLMTEILTIKGSTPIHANQVLVARNNFTFSTGLRDLWRVVQPTGPGSQLWSPLVAGVFVAALALAALGAALGYVSRAAAGGLFLAGTLSLGSIVASVGQVVPNYLALTLPYWAGAAGIGLSWPLQRVWRALGNRPMRVVAGGLTVAMCAWVVLGTARNVGESHREYLHAWAVIREASVAVNAEWGGNCLLATSYAPQVGYYSNCWVIGSNPAADFDARLEGTIHILDPAPRQSMHVGYMLVGGGKRQPTEAQIEQSVLIGPERLFERGSPEAGRRQHVWVQPIDPCVVSGNC